MKRTALLLTLLTLSHSISSIHLQLLGSFMGGNVWRADNTIVNCAKGKLTPVVDGSPHGYHPDGSPPGLQILSKAGHEGDWWGIATDNGLHSGTPVVQGHSDPAPGFYVSTTDLVDPAYSFKSPYHYVDSEKIPFMQVPSRTSEFGWKMGDFCTVCYNGKCVHGIVANLGPRRNFGNTSMMMAKSLGIDDSPKQGGVESGVKYLVYKGSSSKRPQAIPTYEQIQDIGKQLFDANQGDAILAALDDKVSTPIM